jgi:hypothetical protein
MTSALEGDELSAACPGRTLPPGKTRYPLYRRLGGPQGQSGQALKISPPPGFDPRTVQPVVTRCTDWATWPMVMKVEQWIVEDAEVADHGVTEITLLIFIRKDWEIPWGPQLAGTFRIQVGAIGLRMKLPDYYTIARRLVSACSH